MNVSEQEQQRENNPIPGVDVASGSPEVEGTQDEVAMELQKAKAESAELRDSWNRERAEFLNYKKRTIQEMGRARNHAVKAFVTGLLPVLDNLNQVLTSPSTDPAVVNFVQGVEMIRTEFMNVLARENIKAVRPVGEAFDPMRMEAISMEEQENISSDQVIDVYQDGFVMNIDEKEEVIRPARVRVAKAKKVSGDSPDSNSQEKIGEVH